MLFSSSWFETKYEGHVETNSEKQTRDWVHIEEIVKEVEEYEFLNESSDWTQQPAEDDEQSLLLVRTVKIYKTRIGTSSDVR